MKRIFTALLLTGLFVTATARPANPLTVGADLAIAFYQKLLSPLQGTDVCNFSPSCSHFSRDSYQQFGPFWGTLMTFDRLERCNPGAWRFLNQYYDGTRKSKLFDPPYKHYLPLREDSHKKAAQDSTLTKND